MSTVSPTSIADGLCTNKDRGAVTDAVARRARRAPRFRVTTQAATAPKEAGPRAATDARQQLNVEPTSLVMVGDAKQDVECARRNRLRVIVCGVAVFVARRITEANPDVVLDSLPTCPMWCVVGVTRRLS